MPEIKFLESTEFYAEIAEPEVPVLVTFTAPWCGPCRMMGPILESVAEKYAGRLKVVKVNCDGEPALAGQYGVRSIPMMMFFKGGGRDAVDVVVGAVTETQLTVNIEKVLAQ